MNLFNKCMFSGRHITLLCSGTLISTVALCLEAILNREITSKKHQMQKNMTLNIQQKDILIV